MNISDLFKRIHKPPYTPPPGESYAELKERIDNAMMKSINSMNHPSLGINAASLYGNSVMSSQTDALSQQARWPSSALMNMARGGSDVVFRGNLDVRKVANGYILTITADPGDPVVYIAETIDEVNERIATAMVTFKLEGK